MGVKAIKFLDKSIGGLICGFCWIISRGENKINKIKGAKRILVIQLWGVGESILTLPSIYQLIGKFPKSEIDILLTERNKDVYYEIKNIRKINLKLSLFSIINFIFKNVKKYDIVIDMEEYLNISSIISFFVGRFRVGYSHNIRSKLYNRKAVYNDKQHVSKTYLDLLSSFNIGSKIDKLKKLNYSIEDKKNVDLVLKRCKIRKGEILVGIAPGAAESAKSRMWPYERYAGLCSILLKDKKTKIIFVGTNEEKKIINEMQKKINYNNKTINLAGDISLGELFYLVTKLRLFIGNDAGAMHIAAAQGTKTIGLFGPNLPIRFGPLGKNNTAIYKGYNCEFSPCINVHKGQVPDCLFPKKSEDYQKCMKNISVGDVLGEVNKYSIHKQ